MNFKTTIVLIALLAVAGAVLLFTRDRGGEQATTTTDTKATPQKVFADVQANDVTKLAITPADGKKLVVAKTGGKWQMTEPVNAPAEAFEVDGLVRAVAGIESRGEVSEKTADAKATGLASPKYTLDLTAGGKDYTLLVGDKTAVGDNLYVQRKDKGETLVVAADLLEKFDKQPIDYRDKKLVNDYSTAAVNQITITKPDGKIVLTKSGADWKITEPTAMPAEKADVDNIVFDLTGLRATDFVSENATADAAQYDLAQPRVTATLSATASALPAGIAAATQSASSQPTSQPAALVVKFGGYDDVLKKNVYVMTSQSPVIAKVAATALETINKKPIELRDRRVVDLDPTQVSTITISSDVAATTKPTSKPASKTEVVLQKTKPAATRPTTAPTTQLASTKPTTGPATQVAATQPATQPATKWEVATGGSAKPGDDAKVDALLSQLHPLRATKYLEKAPTTQPAATYVLKVTIGSPGGGSYEIHLTDPGNAQPLVGTYNGLAFEADRSLLDRLSGTFLKSDAKPANNFANDGAPEPIGP